MLQLRAIEKSDLPKLKVWRNDIIEMCREYRLLNDEHQERWWADYSQQAYSPYPKHLLYGLELRQFAIKGGAWRLIGVGGWTYIDWLNRRAELSIYIGPRDLRSKGYGRRFLELLHDIAFNQFGFKSVWLEVHDWNPAGRKLYEHAGYTYIGQWRNARYRDGQYWPTHIYDLTAEDYYDNNQRH